MIRHLFIYYPSAGKVLLTDRESLHYSAKLRETNPRHPPNAGQYTYLSIIREKV